MTRPGRWGAVLALGMALLLTSLHAQLTPLQPLGQPTSPQPMMAQPLTVPSVIPAGTPSPAVAGNRAPVAGNSTIRLPLRQLVGATEPIYLLTAQSTYTVFVPISPRYNVKSAKMRLKFTNSIALLSERSTLRVVLNDRVISQHYLTRNSPDHTVDIEIPKEYLKWGSNQLQFIVAQHYTLECEDPEAPELWTQIFPDESYLEAVVSWNPIYPKLSLLRDLIDRKLWETYGYHICFPNSASGSLSASQLSWGSIVAQGAGLNLGYRPSNISTGSTLRAGMDNIVIGQMNELTQYLTATEIGAINGSFIAVKPLPGDPTKFLLIISGTNEAQVGQAAYAFSLINFPLPDSQFATIGSITPQMDKEFWMQHAPLRDPGIYSFRQLGMEEHISIQGWNTGSAQLEVYMPGDLSQDDGSNIELRLHFAYGAAFRDDSVLNVFVNGEFQTAVRLDDQRGAMHYGHKLYLPAKAFQPGRNVVSIAPKMVPLHSNHCLLIQKENLWFTLYRDSDFVVPRLQKKARLPSLTIFSQTAFPFSSTPDGADLAVFMAGKDATSVAATWMLLSKMAQISGSVLYRAEIGYTPPQGKNKDILTVGPIANIPDEVLSTSPVSPAQMGRVRYLVATSPEPEATATGPIAEILEKLRGVPGERAEREQPSTIEMGVNSDLLDDTLAIAYESPFSRARGAMVVTARDSEILYRGIANMQDRLYWDNLEGNLAVWGATPYSLATVRLGPEFNYKETNPIKRAQTRFNSNPLLFVTVVFLSIAVLAVLFLQLLKRREKKAP